jgi:outer membrane protein assembly factor BamE (lipoprotein component of BamABCDE complex)
VTRSRRVCAALAALLACGALSACGKHESEGPVRTAETEGIYLDVSDLKYQVQVSRQLNPRDVQDRAYLLGIPKAEQELKANEVWFGVFLRVQNETATAQLPANDIKIVDTQEEEFRPVTVDLSNPFAYRSSEAMPADETVPLRDTPAFDTPIRGALVLFKLTLTTLGNRPLELEIEGRTGRAQTGIIDLDV